MNVKNIFLVLLLAACQSLAAKNPTPTWRFPRIEFSSEETCNLSAPSYLHIDNIGTNTVTVSWPLVSGAAQYRLQAFDAVTGDGLGSPKFVAGNVTSTSVSTAGNTSGTCYVRIWSVCENGEYNYLNFSQSDNFDTIILDLVVNGYSNQNGLVPDCIVPVGDPLHNSGCPFAWNSTQTKFMVSFTRNGLTTQRRFSLDKVTVSEFDHVQINLDGPETGTLSFSIEKDEEGNPTNLVISNASNTPLARLTVSHPPNANSDGLFYKVEEVNSSCIVYRMVPGGRPGGPIKLPSIKNTKLQYTAKPNPFHDALTLQLPETSFEAETTVSLYNLLGALQQRQSVAAGQTELILNTADLTPGMYILKTESEGNIQTIKVVKTQ